MQTIKNKVIMITGASSGFGEVTAKKLVKEGAKVVLGPRREERLKKICNELGHDHSIYKITDVTKKDDVIALFNKGIRAFDKIDVLINNAGVGFVSKISEGEVDDWERTVDVNIKGVLFGIHSVLNHMLSRGDGQIINICSVNGHYTAPGLTVYSATKHAVRSISDGLRLETKGKIRVTNISPGGFSTEIFNNPIKDKFLANKIKEILPFARSPEHIAEMIVYVLKQNPEISIDELIIKPSVL